MTDQVKGDEHNQVNGGKKKRKRNKNKKNDNNTPVETSEPIPTPVYEDDIHRQNKSSNSMRKEKWRNLKSHLKRNNQI